MILGYVTKAETAEELQLARAGLEKAWVKKEGTGGRGNPDGFPEEAMLQFPPPGSPYTSFFPSPPVHHLWTSCALELPSCLVFY